MNPSKIIKVVLAYHYIVRLLNELERMLFLLKSSSDYINSKEYLIKHQLYGSIQKMSSAYYHLSEVKSFIDLNLEKVNLDCKDSVTQVLINKKSYIYVSMNYYLSESSQRRKIEHFIGFLYFQIRKSPTVNKNFQTVYKIIHAKNN